MAPTGTKRIVWANGEDDFCIAKCEDIWALEERCNNSGIAAILGRLGDGTWRLNDVRETIRLGLIGGGMDVKDAMKVVNLHVDARPFAQSVMLAYEILQAALIGVPDDEIVKKKDEEEKVKASSMTTEGSGDQQSSPSAPVSHGETLEPSVNALSGNLQQPLRDTIEPMVQTSQSL